MQGAVRSLRRRFGDGMRRSRTCARTRATAQTSGVRHAWPRSMAAAMTTSGFRSGSPRVRANKACRVGIHASHGKTDRKVSATRRRATRRSRGAPRDDGIRLVPRRAWWIACALRQRPALGNSERETEPRHRASTGRWPTDGVAYTNGSWRRYFALSVTSCDRPSALASRRTARACRRSRPSNRSSCGAL